MRRSFAANEHRAPPGGKRKERNEKDGDDVRGCANWMGGR